MKKKPLKKSEKKKSNTKPNLSIWSYEKDEMIERVNKLIEEIEFVKKVHESGDEQAIKSLKQIKVNCSNENPSKFMTALGRMNVPHFRSHTQRTTIIKVGLHKFMYAGRGQEYLFSDFHLINKLKLDVKANIESMKKNGINLPKFDKTDIDYFEYSDFLLNMKPAAAENDIDCEISEMEEYDANKAYYVMAHVKGYLSDELFEQCLDLPKTKRLWLLGSIATLKRSYYKIGFKTITPAEDIYPKDPETIAMRTAWFHICKEVDDAMREFKELVGEKDFLMYYVDGIYLRKRKEGYGEILNYIEQKYGCTFKKENTQKIVRVVHENNCDGLAIYKFDESAQEYKPKTFTFPKDEELTNENADLAMSIKINAFKNKKYANRT